MKKFVTEISILAIIVILLSSFAFRIGDVISTNEYGINTEMQIRQSFENAIKSHAKNWILGNSRVYRGINPDVLTTKCYNFAHDNDSYNQMYYKLQFLINRKCQIDTLIIGTDYFQFGVFSNTRNYVYDELLGDDYVKDYTSNFIKEYFENSKRKFITKQKAMYNSMLKYTMRGFHHPKDIPYLKENGQYVWDTKATDNDFIKRNTEMDNLQISYFEKILKVCKDNHIVAIVVMLPVRDNELKSYNTKFTSSFKEMINHNLQTYGFLGNYYDFSNDKDFKNFTKYTDITHLNSIAADEFTKKLWSTIAPK